MAQGKSPFELRAELLRLSFDILSTQTSVAMEKEKGQNPSLSKSNISAPTTEEVVEEAEKLNEFMSRNQRSGNNRS